MLTDDQKERLLRTWAQSRERAGDDIREVLTIGVAATWAAYGTLLEPKTIPCNWANELNYRRHLLATVEAIDASMPVGVNDLQEWINEIRAAVDEAERMASSSSAPAQAKTPSV